MSVIDPVISKAAEGVVTALAQQLGVSVDAEAAVEFAERAIEYLGDAITANAWRAAQEAGQAAAAQITTLEEAEASARRPR